MIKFKSINKAFMSFVLVISFLVSSTARQIKTKNNKYMASDCPLAGKHLKQLEIDTNISNDEALHPIELVAKSYRL